MRRKSVFFGKCAVAAAIAITFCVAHTPSTYAKKRAKYGTIKILSTPAGLPISVDGKPFGQTTTDYRAIDLDPGLHTVVIALPNGQLWTREIDLPAGRLKCVTLNYQPGSALIAKTPCLIPALRVSVPATVSEGEVINYSAEVAYNGSSPLQYVWTVSPEKARIISPPGTPKIMVDSTGLAGQQITARLVVDDGSGDEACRQSAQATTFVPALVVRENPAKEFDVCRNCSFDDQKARLDNLAVELLNDPSTTSYIIAYGGRTSRAGEANRLIARARDYLVTRRGIDRSRIMVMNGGFREENSVDLWLVPGAATPPRPTPTVQAGDVRPATQTPLRSRHRG